jgi:hypothetical protein
MALKFITLTIVVLLISCNLFSQLNSKKILIGKWVGTDRGKTGKFEFLDSTHITVTYPDGTVDNCTYKIDFTKNPVWFDIINSKAGMSRVLKGLIQILNDSTFNWCLSRDGNRPVDYSHPSMTFKKKN